MQQYDEDANQFESENDYSDDFSAHNPSDSNKQPLAKVPAFAMQNFSFKGFIAPEIKPKVVKPLAEGELSDQNYDDDDYEEINDDEDDELFENQYNKKKEEDEEYSS